MKKRTIFLQLSLAAVALLSTAANAQTGKYSWQNLPTAKLPSFKKDTVNITSFGAKGDGVTLNTQSINKAIAACSQKGGGVVVVPGGVWLTGPIELKSHVNLHVDRAALVQFTADKDQYELIEGSFEGKKAIRNRSPLYANNATDIAITGNGIFDGNGDVWRPLKKEKVSASRWKEMTSAGGVLNKEGSIWYPSESYAKGEQASKDEGAQQALSLESARAYKDFYRPNMLVLNSCQRILIQGVTFQNSPAWCLHTLLCENLTYDGVKVRNEPSAQNGDGMDIESCSYVTVQNCTLDCGDDGITIKSGKDEEGRRVGKASQYMVIRNNVVYKAHGGFVIGSEMSGGAHDIFVSDCTFIGSDIGLRFKTTRGRGGIVENIFIRNINMRNIVNDAISFDMYYFVKAPTLAQSNGKVEIPPVNEGTPRFRKIYIDNLVCLGASRGMLIRGLPEMSIEDISVKNAVIRSTKGADIIEAKNVTLDNVQFEASNTRPLINIENSHDLTINKIKVANKPEKFFSINGDRSKNIKVSGTGRSPQDVTADFNYGAKKADLVTKF